MNKKEDYMKEIMRQLSLIVNNDLPDFIGKRDFEKFIKGLLKGFKKYLDKELPLRFKDVYKQGLKVGYANGTAICDEKVKQGQQDKLAEARKVQQEKVELFAEKLITLRLYKHRIKTEVVLCYSKEDIDKLLEGEDGK